jgi:L-rhamnose isomerase
MAHTAQDHVP